MTTKKLQAPHAIYQIKVTLVGTRPPIWRRLLVPADMTLEQLHYVLQAAMGWENDHLHDFRIGQRRFGIPEPNDGFMGLSPVGDESTVRIFTVLGKVGAKAVYTYDFGDDWHHAIAVEKVLPAEEGTTYPVCVGGKRRCPPEDCGGIPGFYNFLEAISNPDHENHEEMQDWTDGDFDPEAFSVDDVNEMLTPSQRGRSEA